MENAQENFLEEIPGRIAGFLEESQKAFLESGENFWRNAIKSPATAPAQIPVGIQCTSSHDSPEKFPGKGGGVPGNIPEEFLED